eukprot:Gb_35764 [translate_table: standard]
MTAIRRALRQVWASRQRIWQTHVNALQSVGLSQCIGHSSDIPVELQRFVQKHFPAVGFLLHRRELVRVRHSQLHPSLIFFGDRLREELQNTKSDAKEGLSSCLDENAHPPKGQVSAKDAERLLRFARLGAVEKRLQKLSHECISYKELLQICMDSAAEYCSEEEAENMANLLDQSGEIMIMGHNVYLHPHKIVRAIENAMPLCMAPPDDPRRKEIEKMEKEKAEIDAEAERQVHRELRCGFVLSILQTAGLMNLIFWELTWDVMEPICFFLFSAYSIAGYFFFLRTSREPTFEGLYESRFKRRQRRLMKKRNFDIERYKELQSISKPGLKSPELKSSRHSKCS